MPNTQRSAPRRRREPAKQSVAAEPSRSWEAVLGKAVFEIAIVAVGVMLALAVDEWRERSEQKDLADEARAALRAEILSNHEAVLSRLRRTAQLYIEIAAHPDQAGKYISERRNRTLFVNNAAWTMAVETGAVRWLTPAERTNFAEIYAGQQRTRDLVSEEMNKWTELGGFPAAPATADVEASRNRALRIWQAWTQRAQFALCVNAGRYERALGADVPEAGLVEFCAGQRPEEDPASIYREWRRLHWASSIAPRTLGQMAAGDNSSAKPLVQQ